MKRDIREGKERDRRGREEGKKEGYMGILLNFSFLQFSTFALPSN